MFFFCSSEAEEDRSSLLEQIQELERERARLKEERDELEAFKSYWIQSGPHRGVTTAPHGVDEMTPQGGSASGVMDEGVIGGGGGGIDIHGVEGILLPTTSQSGKYFVPGIIFVNVNQSNLILFSIRKSKCLNS